MSTAMPRERDGEELFHELTARRGGVPLGVHLQIADRCNHVCVHCYQVQGLKGELSALELRGVLERLAEAGVLALNVSGGEVTLRHDLLEILRDARALGFAIRLYTNAFAMTEALAAGIATIGVLEVHVSVYSDRADEHDAVTRVPGSLVRTLEGIGRLRAHGVRVLIKVPSLRRAAGANQRLQSLGARLGCEIVTSMDITAREDGATGTMLEGMSGEDLVANGLATPWSPADDAPGDVQTKRASPSCGVCVASVTVLPNGEVHPCTDTHIPLGNVLERPLQQILQESPDVQLFRELTWNDVHGCRDCDLLSACHRCHATALKSHGDYLGPYESACEKARARYAASLDSAIVIECEPGVGRNDRSGPYKIRTPGVLTQIEDRLTPRDVELRQQHPWIVESAADRPEGFVPVTRLKGRSVLAAKGAEMGTTLS